MAETAVLISGGVDSAVAVELLKRQGKDLHLFYIRIGMDNGEGDCSAEEDIEMCTLIARRYGLPFDVVSLHEEYWDYVMEYTLRTVRSGRTPHPDMMCNKLIKFGFFEERWGHEFEKTATGHYASIRESGDRLFLGTAADPVKDQTDFLSQISYSQLEHILFPLGDLPKSEVRRLALEARLPNAGRKDSQGICFLGKINYNDFLLRHLGERPGAVIDIATGKKIGEHKGFWFHTIGQRKGLGLSGGPWFVVRKNIRDNVLYVSKGYDTPLQYGRSIELQEMNWISGDPFAGFADPAQGLPPLNTEILHQATGNRLDIAFKNRHMPNFLRGHLVHNPEDDSLRVESETDVQGIAPGQYVTIYDSSCRLCFGSGMIASPGNKI